MLLRGQLRAMAQRLRAGFILAGAGLGILAALNMWNAGVCYLVGFLTGALNLLLLSLFIGHITNAKYRRPVLLHGLFFTARYLLILNMLLYTANPEPVEIILFCSGLLSVNFSVIASFYRFRVKAGEEG